jgi:hypothetical protein
MNESRRLDSEWDDDELTVTIAMYFLGGLRDSHGHDEIARYMGRHNPNTRSYHDGAVNQKLSEIMGYVEHGRVPRHAGEKLMSLVDRYRNSHEELREAAVAAWRRIAAQSDGPTPPNVIELLS